NISKSDMYQMLAYAVRFAERENKKVEIVLIYPKNPNFSTIKRFIISTSCGQIQVSAEPFDIENDINPFPENSVIDKLKKALPQ
ncbi:5-methylcytosine restriction system specificity protein McrC, partial [Persephonella sp.]